MSAPSTTPMADASATRRGRGLLAGVGRNVVALSVVSLFTDVSSEMIYPLLPAFLGATLGASAGFIGVIEGAAESTAALLKLASGWWSDRVRRRKPLVVAGYVLASAVRPLVGIAQSAAQVLAIRLTDRVGKGIRTSPRDALIADSVSADVRGRAFGLHRAADHMGAVLGPLAAFALMRWVGVPVRGVFLWSAVPAAIAVAVLVGAVREVPRRAAGPDGGSRRGRPAAGGPPQLHDAADSAEASHHTSAGGHDPTPLAALETEPGGGAAADLRPAVPDELPGRGLLSVAASLGGRFWAFLVVVLVFTLGNSTDAFLLLRAGQLGIPTAELPVLWAVLHLVKSSASVPGGALSDRVGRRPLIVAGWLLYAAVYLAFGRATGAAQAWALFAVYGVYFGLAEGAEKALVADLVPASRRGAAFGWYNLAISAGALPASILFGVVWDRVGAATAFTLGGALALAAAVGLAFVPLPHRRLA
jgi:MFS family permease